MRLPRLRNILMFGLTMAFGCLAVAATTAPATPPTPVPPGSWPRHVKLANALVVIYQPQINSWADNRLDFRSALAIKPNGAEREAFGLWLCAACRWLYKQKDQKTPFESLPDDWKCPVCKAGKDSFEKVA